MVKFNMSLVARTLFWAPAAKGKEVLKCENNKSEWFQPFNRLFKSLSHLHLLLGALPIFHVSKLSVNGGVLHTSRTCLTFSTVCNSYSWILAQAVLPSTSKSQGNLSSCSMIWSPGTEITHQMDPAEQELQFFAF